MSSCWLLSGLYGVESGRKERYRKKGNAVHTVILNKGTQVPRLRKSQVLIRL